MLFDDAKLNESWDDGINFDDFYYTPNDGLDDPPVNKIHIEVENTRFVLYLTRETMKNLLASLVSPVPRQEVCGE